MAQIGYGYGSEWQLLRFLGHHRDLLNKEICNQTGIVGDYHWLDFGFADRNKVISGDKEIKGISFIKKLGIVKPSVYSELEKEYKSYKIGKISNWQNWDAILVVNNNSIYLIEAKAHKEELSSAKNGNGGTSEKQILKYMREQLPELNVTEEWMKEYYQLANRLATTALLNKHLNKVGISVRTMGIYFVNGYCRTIFNEDEEPETINKDASKDDFKKAITKEMETLGLGLEDKSLENLLTKPVFIDCLVKIKK